MTATHSLNQELPAKMDTPQLAKLMRLTPAEIGVLVAKRALPSPARENGSDCYWNLDEIYDFLRSELAAYNKRRTGRSRNPATLDSVSWRRLFSPHITSSQVVLEAVEDIARDAGFANRNEIVALTGLDKGVVDDRLKALIQRGLIQRIRPGAFTLASYEEREPRAISLTHLPDGTSKLEFGDVCETLSANERRRLAQLLVGDAMQLSNLQAGRDANLLAQELFLVTNMLRTADSERIAALARAGVDVKPMPWPGVSPHLERFVGRLSALGAASE